MTKFIINFYFYFIPDNYIRLLMNFQVKILHRMGVGLVAACFDILVGLCKLVLFIEMKYKIIINSLVKTYTTI